MEMANHGQHGLEEQEEVRRNTLHTAACSRHSYMLELCFGAAEQVPIEWRWSPSCQGKEERNLREIPFVSSHFAAPGRYE
jgi:hypothetical protein